MRFSLSVVASLVAGGCSDAIVYCRPRSWDGDSCGSTATLFPCPAKSTQRIVTIQRKGCSKDTTKFTVTEIKKISDKKNEEQSKTTYSLADVGDANCDKLAKSVWGFTGNVRKCIANEKFCYNPRASGDKVDREEYVSIRKAQCDVSKPSCVNKIKLAAAGKAIAATGALAGLAGLFALDEVDSAVDVAVAPNSNFRTVHQHSTEALDGGADTAGTFEETNIEAPRGGVDTGHEVGARYRTSVLRNT